MVALLSLTSLCFAVSPDSLECVGRTLVPMREYATDVFVSGNYAYLGVGDYQAHGELHIIDITDSTNPRPVGYIYTGLVGSGYTYSCRGVFVSGNYAYIANGSTRDHNFEIIDITDKAHPYRVGYFRTTYSSNGCKDVFVVDTLAYVTDREWGLIVINVKDKTNPTLVDTLEKLGGGGLLGVFVSGGYAYMARYNILYIVDISDPADLQLAGSFPLAGTNPSGCQNVFVADTLAYLASDDSMRVVNVKSPSNPYQVASVYLGETHNDVQVVGGYAYLTGDWDRSVTVVDLSTLSVVGSFISDGEWNGGIFVTNNRAYVAIAGRDCGQNRLEIVDVSQPSNPTFLGSYWTSLIKGIAVDGSIVYAGDNSWLLHAVDMSDPSTPNYLGKCELQSGKAVYGDKAVAIYGNYAFVAIGSGGCGAGLKVVDISEPADMSVVAYINPPDGSFSEYDIAVDGNYAYLVGQKNGYRLWIADISVPTSPSCVSILTLHRESQRISLDGDYLYVASKDSGLVVINVADRTNPYICGRYDPPGCWAREVKVVDSHAYVVDYDSLKVLDISDPTNPSLIGACDVPADWGFCSLPVMGDYAYMSLYGRIGIYNISDPTNPYLVEISQSTYYSIYDLIALPGKLLYQAGSNGLFVYRHVVTGVEEENSPPGSSEKPCSFALFQNYPNPFNTGSVIAFDLPSSGKVNLSVYNLAGQKVNTLVSGIREPGRHLVSWNGKDEVGRDVGSGIYLYQLKESNGIKKTRKMLLLR